MHKCASMCLSFAESRTVSGAAQTYAAHMPIGAVEAKQLLLHPTSTRQALEAPQDNGKSPPSLMSPLHSHPFTDVNSTMFLLSDKPPNDSWLVFTFLGFLHQLSYNFLAPGPTFQNDNLSRTQQK